MHGRRDPAARGAVPARARPHHRLSTIVQADRIVVLKGGRLVQSGSYQELANQPGTAADLVKRQLS